MKKLNFKISDLWRWDGTIGPKEYLVLGLALSLVKYNIDRLIASIFFQRPWTLFYYLAQPVPWNDPDQLPFYLTMVAVALPFIWSGIVLTLRRLRSAGLDWGWTLLFFVPLANLLFFAMLSVLPPREEVQDTPRTRGWLWQRLYHLIPSSKWGSAAAAVFVSVFLTVAGTAFSTSLLSTYGLGLFVGMPFCLGMVSVLIYSCREPRSYSECMRVCFYSIVIAGATLLGVAFEGLICLVMAGPLAIGLALAGGSIAHFILRVTWWRHEADKLICAAILAIPAMIGTERLSSLESPLLCVRSSLDVKAPPEVVWRHVVNFSELAPPKEWLFHIGIAYPIRAEIRGQGVGAVRRCEFSTGPFVEPIEVWDEPRRLAFAVTENPAPLEEWTPYHHIHPPHLSGFLVSEHGQFLLTRNSDGTTHLEGTTWYRHHMWPAAYWQIWSDMIIHKIHLRVLNHVKALAEMDKTP